MPNNRYMKKGVPIGGLRAVNINQKIREPRQIGIRLSNQHIQELGELRQLIQANNHQEIQNVNQEENNIQGQEQQIQRQGNNNGEELGENRRRNRGGGVGQRGSGRSNERNRMDLE